MEGCEKVLGGSQAQCGEEAQRRRRVLESEPSLRLPHSSGFCPRGWAQLCSWCCDPAHEVTELLSQVWPTRPSPSSLPPPSRRRGGWANLSGIASPCARLQCSEQGDGLGRDRSCHYEVSVGWAHSPTPSFHPGPHLRTRP